jgi:hypothetical protein
MRFNNMVRQFLASLVVSTVLFPLPADGDQTKKPEELAKKVALKFIKALKARNAENAIALADVPWINLRGRVLKDPMEMKKDLQNLIERLPDTNEIPEQILKTVIYRTFRKQLQPMGREACDQVLGKQDWIVMFARDGEGAISVMTRRKGGQARVVGIGG